MIQRFKNLPLSLKIFSVFVLILLLVSFFNFIYFPWKQKQQVIDAMQDRAESVAQMLAAGVSLALEEGDFEFINRLLTLAKKDENILYIAICDAEGQPTVSFNPNELSIPSKILLSSSRTIEASEALHTKALLEISGIQRFLIIGFSLRERDSAIDEIRITGFLISLAILIFALLLSVYLSRLIVNPLSELVGTIDYFGKTEDHKITLQKSGSDEVGKLIDAFNDMTSALHARTMERKQAVESLGESEERFRSLVQTAGDAILVLAPDYRILEWNREAERVHGWRREEVLGKDYFELFLPAEAREGVAADVQKVLLGEPTRGYVNPVVGRDGTRRMLQWNVARLLDAEEQPIGIIACGQDITEQQLLEQRLRQSQKMEAVGQLTAGVAHNFNNMLAGILGSLEMALERAPAPLKTILRQAEHSSERVAAMIKQLMLFTRTGNSVESESIEIHKILDETVGMCRATFDRRIEMVVDRPDVQPVLLGDSDQLQQVFLNLLLNARDALEDGSRRDPRIEIAIDSISKNEENRSAHIEAPPGPYARVRITDNGVGMDESTRDRVFEPFFTTKEVGRGTGLGLSSAYAIVRQHRGWIDCESRPGSGTVFSIHLPIADRGGTSQATEGEDDVAQGTETLLVIDDEEIIRNLVSSQLSKFGYTVLLGTDGKDGLDVFRRKRDEIALILLDVSMPNMSGHEILPILRSLNPEVKVIVITGYAAASTQLPEVQAVMQKPFKQEDLARTVRDVLDA